MVRRFFIKSLGLTGLGSALHLQSKATPLADTDRAFWLNHLDKLAKPVLNNLAANTLKATMPVEGKTADRPEVTHLEAFGRLMTGIGPWLNLTEIADTAERNLQQKYFELAGKALHNATNPAAKDYLNFTKGGQPLVDAAFLAHGLIRAPRLWNSLTQSVKDQIVKAFASSRSILPYPSNWLLFSAMIEAFLAKFGYEYDKMRIDYAVRQHEQWYKGDGIYGDGADFHWDYYNSYVIQPFLYDILITLDLAGVKTYNRILENVTKRAVRYAAIQERLVAPDGTFPVVGRSIPYRAGAFQHLANMVLHQKLPAGVSNAQIRGALTAVLHKTTDNPGNFDSKGWLTIGLNGHQPDCGESYISTGSLYLCASVLLPLGLPASHSFWADKPEKWTSQKVWSGENFKPDHAL